MAGWLDEYTRISQRNASILVWVYATFLKYVQVIVSQCLGTVRPILMYAFLKLMLKIITVIVQQIDCFIYYSMMLQWIE